MLCFIDHTTDPYFNLAAEEYLLKQYTSPIFRLWRNDASIIIGRYQNALAQINVPYVNEHHIPVVRRLSGGGAVYHDLGNINFTFIDQRIEGEDTSGMFKRFTAPIIEALRGLGVAACLEGRNDLVIDGRKFSGNSICVYQNRVLQHGTLLFASSMGSLSQALITRPEKFKDKSVKSNAARVTNISEHLSDEMKTTMDSEHFMEYLTQFIMSKGGDYTLSHYSEKEMENISRLATDKYSTREWNYGESPKYQFSNSIKLPCGMIEVFLDVDKGIIRKCRIMGDFFFLRPVDELCEALEGVPHRYDDIFASLSSLPIRDYFGDDIIDELTAVFL